MKSKLLSAIIAVASTFALTNTANATELSQTQAFNQLLPDAIEKLTNANIDINALLFNDANDLIVNFDESAFPVDNRLSTSNVATRAYRSVKDDVLTDLDTTTVLRDYYGSPTSFVRVESLDDLVELLNNPSIVSVFPNIRLQSNLSQSLNFIKQPQAERLTFSPNYGATSSFNGEGSVVAVLDTGLDANRSAFGNCSRLDSPTCKVAVLKEFARDANGRTDGEYDDGSFHGTNVSGVVAGVAPRAKLISLDVFGFDGYGHHTSPSDAIQGALNWIKNNHKSRNPNGYNIVATNMSLGDTQAHNRPSSNFPIIQTLKSMGIATVAASGNDEYSNGINWPASERGAIAVGAVYDQRRWGRLNCRRNSNDIRPDEVTCFSNSHSMLDLLAPGYDIRAAGITMTGTSQATPHVAGAIALFRAPAVQDYIAQYTGSEDSVDDTVARLSQNGVSVRDYRNSILKPRIDLLATAEDIKDLQSSGGGDNGGGDNGGGDNGGGDNGGGDNGGGDNGGGDNGGGDNGGGDQPDRPWWWVFLYG